MGFKRRHFCGESVVSGGENIPEEESRFFREATNNYGKGKVVEAGES
jgi:hypothetical protein